MKLINVINDKNEMFIFIIYHLSSSFKCTIFIIYNTMLTSFDIITYSVLNV